MRIIKRSVKLASVIAALAAALVLLTATDGASAKNQAGGNSDTNAGHVQNTIHPMIAKNDHGHKRRHRFSRLSDNQAYCNCSYEFCPEWIIVQCIGYRPQDVVARRAKPVPRCFCSISDLTDTNYN
jgi:hypothetical protein